jgi:hypothetical protein
MWRLLGYGGSRARFEEVECEASVSLVTEQQALVNSGRVRLVDRFGVADQAFYHESLGMAFVGAGNLAIVRIDCTG